MTLNNILKRIVILGTFATLFIPFIVFESLFFPFITGKNFMFRVIVEIIFASWLILAFRDATYRPRKSWLLWAFVAFTAIIGIADIFGQNPGKSFWSNFERMEGYITTLHLFAYFIAASSVLVTEKIWKRFLEWSIWTSLCVSLYGLLQLSGKAIINQGGVRVDATFGNATYLAIYLAFNIFFALILIYRDKRLWKSITYGAIALLHFIILYHTATRGTMLGLIGGLFLASLLIAVFDKTDKRMRIIGASISGGLILIVLGFILIKDASFVKNSPVLSRFAAISLDDTRTQARGYIWPMAMKGFTENPVLGRGQENFNYVFNANYDPRMYSQEQWFDHTHNIVLDWLVAGGILGVLAHLSLYGIALFLLWRRAGDMTLTEKALITGLIAAYFFHNLFVFDNIVSAILFVSLLSFIHFKSTRFEKPLLQDKEEIDDAGARVFGSLVFIVLVFVLYFFNWRGYQTSKSLIVALQALNTNPVSANIAIIHFKKALSYESLGYAEVVERIVESIPRVNSGTVSIEDRQEFYELGRQAVEKQLERSQGDARYEVFAGNFYSQYNNPAEAEKHLLRATEYSPNKQTILFQLGNFYLLSNQMQKAVATFKKAYDLDTSYDNAGQLYAVSLVYANREAEARAFLKERFGSEDMTGDMFLQAYAAAGTWPRVISILRSRIESDPKNTQNWMNLVSAYYQSGNKAAAIGVLREMIAIDPTFKATGEEYIRQIEAGN